MSNAPIITIIIPIYNAENTIQQCLNSIKSTWQEGIEAICIDDGSNDSSGSICEEYAKKNQWIKVFHQSNQGVASARNLGLKYAKGKYIAWVDADDTVEKEWSEYILQEIKLNSPDCILFAYNTVKNYKCIHKRLMLDHNVKQKKYIYELSVDKTINSFLWNRVIKSSFFIDKEFDCNALILEDFDMVTRLAPLLKKITYLDIPLYNYYISSNSLSHQYNSKKMRVAVKKSIERYRMFQHLGYDVDKSGYWSMYIGLYNILCNESIENNVDELTGIKRYMWNNLRCIIVSKTLGVKQKVEVLLMLITPYSVYQKIYYIYYKNK